MSTQNTTSAVGLCAAVDELQRCLAALADAIQHAQRHGSSDSEGGKGVAVLGRLDKLEHATLPQLRAKCERVVCLKQELVSRINDSLLPARAQLVELQQAAGVAQLDNTGAYAELATALDAWHRAAVPPSSAAAVQQQNTQT